MMQCTIDTMPDVENITFRFASVPIIPIFQYSNIPHPYGMLLNKFQISLARNAEQREKLQLMVLEAADV